MALCLLFSENMTYCMLCCILYDEHLQFPKDTIKISRNTYFDISYVLCRFDSLKYAGIASIAIFCLVSPEFPKRKYN